MTMRTPDRLTEAYTTARVEEFDDHSKYVFFSDCHRGDGSIADEFAKNKNIYLAAMEYYLDEGFTYVEVGDGDEMWEYKDFKVVIKANGTPFKLLMKFHDDNRFIMLYGNHNMQMQDPAFVQKYFEAMPGDDGSSQPFMPGLEPCEALVLRHRVTGQEILTVHGHQGDFSNDQNWRFTMWSFRLFWKYLHAFGIRSPSSPVRNIYRQHKVERNYVDWIQAQQTALICGHTHREKFAGPNEIPYFNSGCCTYPSYIIGLEISGGSISMVGWRVEADPNRYLHVVRRVIGGPVPLAAYDLKAKARARGAAQPAGASSPAQEDYNPEWEPKLE